MNGFASFQYLHVFQCCADLGPGRYGSVPHAGFGVGFERLVMLATGVTWCMSWEGGWMVKVLAKRNFFNGKKRKRKESLPPEKNGGWSLLLFFVFFNWKV